MHNQAQPNLENTMKVKIEKILVEFIMVKTFARSSLDYEQPITQATSSLTALIIKWLESKKEDMKESGNYAQDISLRPFKIIRNQLITELIGELR